MFTVSFSPTKQRNVDVVAHPKFVCGLFEKKSLQFTQSPELQQIVNIFADTFPNQPTGLEICTLYDLQLFMLQCFPVF